MFTITRRGVLGAMGLAASATVLSACSSAADSGDSTGESATGGNYLVPTKTGKLRVGFSNSFAGNAFRTQMILELEEQAGKMPDDIESLTVTDANNSVDKQLSDINDLLTKGIDVLLIDAASSTALSTTVQRAQQQGVLVVSFDNAVESEYGIVVNIDHTEFGHIGGEWLADVLQADDSVVTLDGSSGSPVNDDRLNGAKEKLTEKQINIVAGADTDWDQAKGQSAANDLLAAHPDIQGIYSQGGAPSLGAINAMEQQGSAILPITGEGYNGFLKKWKELKDSTDFESIAPCNPPAISAEALKIAVSAMRGTDPGPTPMVDIPVITQDTLEDYVRTDLPDAFFLPTSLSEETIRKNYLD